MGAGDPFTKRKFAWLFQLASDPDLAGLAVKVGIVLAHHLNRQTGEAFPSQMTIAKAVGASEDGVRKATLQLEARGHLGVQRSLGRHNVHRYWPLVREAQTPDRRRANQPPKSQTGVGPLFDETPDSRPAETPDRRRKNPRPQSGQNPLREPTEGEPFEKRSRAPRRKPETSLPANSPTDHDFAWAADRAEAAGLALDLNVEAERFKAHHRAKDTRFRDWAQAWRTWILNAIRYAEQRGARPRQSIKSGLAWATEELDQ